jgi:hypothetical protein
MSNVEYVILRLNRYNHTEYIIVEYFLLRVEQTSQSAFLPSGFQTCVASCRFVKER